jgi:NAD(P)-dependent dehydrogenase (short-subunit alcohol dehydrogenase family)
LKKFKKIDILINIAGSPDDYTAAAEMGDDVWDRTIKLLLYAPFYASKDVMIHMLKAKKGNIINISSLAGVTAGRARVAYICAKHAVIGLTKNTAFMYANEGIRCSTICPGAVNTPLVRGVSDGTIPANKTALEKCTSGAVNMPRVGEPEEIASIAVFLASNDSSLINGSVIAADSGWSAY